ncbi:hypothetical protein A3K63_01385 [Candidatus Micrarchaeota archaeon RBG_16_49_10]|nr:MAG: hypothetical protein A3K63_01385 [Candidatus Micrarchaeota archaeon RBG_16_49_10]
MRITAELDNGQQLKSSETTFQVGQGEKTVIINSDNAITDDDYRVIVKLEYDYTSSAFINFFFLKGSAKDTTYTKPQGPVDVSIRVRPTRMRLRKVPLRASKSITSLTLIKIGLIIMKTMTAFRQRPK